MLVNDDRGQVFISVPKCGTHSFYSVLTKERGWRRVGTYHNLWIPDSASSYEVVMPTRNPYKRAVSFWWRECQVRGSNLLGVRAAISLTRFYRDKDSVRIRPQAYRLLRYPGATKIDIDDADLSLLGLDGHLPKVMFSKGRPRTEEILTPEAAEAIEEWCPDDFLATGHEKWRW